jgi:hypothetical protein
MTSPAPTPRPRWFHLTPDRLIVGLLAVEGFLLLSERFQWFAFNEHKGWTVLIAVGTVGLMMLLTLLWFAASVLVRWPLQFTIRLFLVPVLAVAIPCSWLAVTGRFHWFVFNEKKFWTVLIAVVTVGLAFLAMLLWLIGGTLLRRRFQFSIWSLFVLVLVVAIPCSWMAVEQQRAENQREAVAEMRKAGVWIRYDYQVDTSGLEIPNARPSEPEWLRRLLGDDFCAGVVNVGFFGTHARIVDTELERLKELREVRNLWFTCAPVTDTDLEHLRGIPHLERLYLGATRVTDAGLEHLQEHKQLRVLVLGGTRVTDSGLEHLAGFIHLRELNLSATRITDSGLERLRYLTELRVLYLGRTKVTDEGVKRLQKALPNCTIQH